MKKRPIAAIGLEKPKLGFEKPRKKKLGEAVLE